MKLRIHYMDGERREIEFGAAHPQAFTWRPTDRALVVWNHSNAHPGTRRGDRLCIPWSSVRCYEVLIEAGDEIDVDGEAIELPPAALIGMRQQREGYNRISGTDPACADETCPLVHPASDHATDGAL